MGVHECAKAHAHVGMLDTPWELAVLAHVGLHADSEGRVIMSRGELAEETGLSTRTITRALAGLRDKGLIENEPEKVTVARGRRVTPMRVFAPEWNAPTRPGKGRP